MIWLLPRAPISLPSLAACAVLAGTLGACGSSEDEEVAKPVLPIVQSEHPPATYLTDDEACLAGDATPQPVSGTTIFAWKGDGVVQKQVSLVGITSGDSLTSDLVSVTTWRDDFERTCDYSRPRGRECLDSGGREKGWIKTGSGGNLRICKNGKSYGRESYEGVALTSLHNLQTAHERYKSLAPNKRELPQITLSVLPRFVDYYENYVKDGKPARLATYITHNMAYFPRSEGTSPLIAVFPESDAQRAEAKGFFWESSFVLAHEYSHHVDFSRTSGTLMAMGLQWNPMTHSFDDVGALARGITSTTAEAAIQGAVAEGFADLLAYYAAGGSSEALVGLPCFGLNRDISKATFQLASGEVEPDEKMLTEDRLDALFGRLDLGTTRCGEPNYHDIHTIGAIFAHTLDGVFSRLVATTETVRPGSPDDISARYRLALEWNDEFLAASKAAPASADGAALLEPVSFAVERVASRFLTTFPLRDEPDAAPAEVQTALCEMVRERLPAAPRAPFQKRSGC